MQRIKEFFEKKVKAQHLSGPDLGGNDNFKGTTLCSPLLGVAGSPVPSSTSKRDRYPIPVARGRGGNKKEGRKRTPVVLERWFGPKTPRAECPGPEEEKEDHKSCPERCKEESNER